MYLKTLSLRNFRCFENLDVDFHPKVSVVVGKNGSGKTAILESASIALGTLFTSFDGLVCRRINKTDARLKPYELGTGVDVQSLYPVEITAVGKIGDQNVEWKRSLNGENGNTTVKDAKSIIDVAKTWRRRMNDGDAKLLLPIVAYYGTGRLWDYHREKKSDAFKINVRSNGYVDALDGTANVKLMLNWFNKQQYKQYLRQRRGEVDATTVELEAVYRAMESYYALITGYADVDIQYNPDSNELDVYYTKDDGLRMRIPLSQCSDGYKCTISLVADVAYRMAVLNPQLLDSVTQRTEGVVLIDEIDLHLHPDWQERILDDLQTIFPKVQFIVTTHAPKVISSVKRENLIKLEDMEACYPEGEVYGKDVNAIISGIMESNQRPKEVNDWFRKFYQEIDAKNLEQAAHTLNLIEEKIGNDDGELTSCRVRLKILQITRGKGRAL